MLYAIINMLHSKNQVSRFQIDKLASHWAEGVQITLVYRYFIVSDVEITLYQRYLKPLCPVGYIASG